MIKSIFNFVFETVDQVKRVSSVSRTVQKEDAEVEELVRSDFSRAAAVERVPRSWSLCGRCSGRSGGTFLTSGLFSTGHSSVLV